MRKKDFSDILFAMCADGRICRRIEARVHRYSGMSREDAKRIIRQEIVKEADRRIADGAAPDKSLDARAGASDYMRIWYPAHPDSIVYLYELLAKDNDDVHLSYCHANTIYELIGKAEASSWRVE